MSENNLTARSAYAERAKLKKQQDAQLLAQMVASAINPSTQNTAQPTISLEEFNKLKAELEQTKQLLQQAQQESEKIKPVVNDWDEKLKDQLETVSDFIRDRLIANPTARVLNHDMNFELIEYAKEVGCYINSREVKGLLEKFNIQYKPSNGQYYYIGVEFRQ